MNNAKFGIYENIDNWDTKPFKSYSHTVFDGDTGFYIKENGKLKLIKDKDKAVILT